LIGGSLCLDFVNTVGGRAGGAVIRDKIASFPDLVAWSLLAGIVDPTGARALARRAARGAREAASVLERAVQFREALYRILLCVVEGRRPAEADADVLRREVSMARAHERLAAHGGAFEWTLPERMDALDRVLWPVSLSAAELLASGDLYRLRQCGGETCSWMFLDTTRNRSRQWCDMRDCGNRAKVRRFRERHREGARSQRRT
jgi:predicted RNA-binding Zn ribbon-like protein